MTQQEAILKNATDRVLFGLRHKDKGIILSAYDMVQGAVDLENVSDELFKKWDEATTKANDFLYS